MTNVVQNVNHRITGYSLITYNYFDGRVVTPHDSSYSRSILTKELEKTPLTRNPVINGWRKPSPYYLRSATVDPGHWFVVLEQPHSNQIVKREFFGTPGLDMYSPYYTPVLTAGKMRTASQSARSVVMSEESVRAARNNVAARAFQLSSSLLEARSSVQGLARLSTALADSYLGVRMRSAKRVYKALGHPKGREREFKQLKRVLRRSAVNSPRGFSEALLTVEWGLKPIIDDMVGIAAYLSDDSKFYFVNGVGHSGKQETFPLAPSRSGIPLGQAARLRENLTAVQKWGYRTSLWFEVSVPELRNLAKYGLSDLPTALWAVVPWSFAVDWVIPVSQYLSSLTATYGLKWKGGTTTYYSQMEVKSEYTLHEAYSNNSNVAAWEGVPAKGKLFEMDRRVHSSEPLGLVPTIRDPFGAYQAVMSLALLGARIPKQR